MATWQYDIYFIPNEISSTLPQKDSDGSFDDSFWWTERQPVQDLNELFSKFGLPSPSWSNDLTLFGKEDETCIKVWRETKKVSSIEARIDLRSVTIEIIESIAQSAITLGCKFYLPEIDKIYDPDVTLLVEEIQKSNASDFVENPKRFLMNLQVKRNQN